MSEAVRFEATERVARLTIDRADRRNALSPDVIKGLAQGIARAEAEDAGAIVITGEGDRAFCAGGDLGGMVADGKVAQHQQRSEMGDLLLQMRASRLPIVARVNGHALGGGFGLMLGCDLVVAVDDAMVGTPEINIGLWPFMISAVLRRDIPRKIALEMMLTGGRVTAGEAARWGFVNRVVPRAELDAALAELVAQVLSKSPLIVALGKRSFYRIEDMGTADAMEYLAGMLTLALESEDAVEGVTAFLQKRDPEWKGK